jgi:hypothetical protein
MQWQAYLLDQHKFSLDFEDPITFLLESHFSQFLMVSNLGISLSCLGEYDFPNKFSSRMLGFWCNLLIDDKEEVLLVTKLLEWLH